MAETVNKSAIIDETGKYRYSLTRSWGQGPRITFVMLNPSTADAKIDDPTIRRCIGFSKREGAGSIEVVNLFAYRATNPKELKIAKNPIGPDNNKFILEAAERSSLIIAAWGTNGSLLKRDLGVETLLRSKHWPLNCLGRTKAGHPKHPLYLSSETKIQTYRTKLTT